MIRRRKFDRGWFEARLRERELSQRGFARQIRIDPARVSVLFNGKGPVMTIAEAQTFSDALRHPMHEILRRAGIEIESQTRVVKITGYVDSHSGVHYAAKDTEDETDGPLDLPTEAFALQVRTHNSRFSWLDRWLVYVSGIQQHVNDLRDTLALVALHDGDICIGEVRKGYKDGTINIQLGGDVIHQNTKAKWAMRILWLRPSGEHEHEQPSERR